MRLTDCTPGLGVVYRPVHAPASAGEDGEVVRVSGSLVMVRYRNGPQAGKVCATNPVALTPATPRHVIPPHACPGPPRCALCPPSEAPPRCEGLTPFRCGNPDCPAHARGQE